MYNKLFTKILDSSIWLEPDATRIVWITMIAAMDQDGFCQFASVANVAHRAMVPLEAAERAIRALQSPDKNSSDPDHKGRRLERVDGGWMVLNAQKYRELITREISRHKTLERVRKYREKRRKNKADVTGCNAGVTDVNVLVTPSDALALGSERSHERSTADGQTESAPRPRPTMRDHMRNENALKNQHADKHAWCSWPTRDGLCVTHGLHSEILGRSQKPESEVRDWYRATVARYDGQPVGDDVFAFWRNELARWLGTVTAKPRQTRDSAIMAASLRVTDDSKGGVF